MVFAETCRIIQFVHKVNEKALEGHTITTINSNKVDFCETRCFLNHDCVSYHFRKKKGNNCSPQIIASLSNKLVKIFFLSIQLPFANLLCSQILMIVTMMFVMLMLTVPTLMVLIIASVRKDTLKMNSLVNID